MRKSGRMKGALIWYVRCLAGLGAIYVALSEVLFYPISADVSVGLLTLVYAIAAVFGVVLVAARGGGGWIGFFVAALVLGFVAEGVPVAALYLALPFSLLWTSMAWHAVISGLIGVWLYRAMAGNLLRFGLFNLGLGMGLGLWGAYFWGATPELVDYTGQALIGMALFIGGHAVLPVGIVPAQGQRVILGLTGAVLLAGWVLQGVVVMNPTVLVLPVMVALCWFAGKAGEGPLWPALPLGRFWPALFCPAAALATYHLTLGTALVAEMNAYVILTAGPASIALSFWACWRAVRA